jgi:fructose-bisphosphate aldolase class II
LKTPVLIGVSEGERDFIGVEQIAALVKSLRDEYDFPIFLNADHTHTLEAAIAAAKAGFDEILFDGSKLPFEENIKKTREAVDAIRSIRGEILVEGEIGYLGSSSQIIESIPEESLKFTTPEEASEFVRETGVDVLSPAVGTMHGLLPSMAAGQRHKRLQIKLIEEIKKASGSFLTLHGGSGTDEGDTREAIAAGINIIHVNTELRIAWRKGVEEGLKDNPEELAPYKILPPAVKNIGDLIERKLKLFSGS